MSLTGRYIIDRTKGFLKQFKLPCPPYNSPHYWDAAYKSCKSNNNNNNNNSNKSSLITCGIFFEIKYDKIINYVEELIFTTTLHYVRNNKRQPTKFCNIE
jgi:hypothetical protein